jgi:hypothetical protein
VYNDCSGVLVQVLAVNRIPRDFTGEGDTEVVTTVSRSDDGTVGTEVEGRLGGVRSGRVLGCVPPEFINGAAGVSGKSHGRGT